MGVYAPHSLGRATSIIDCSWAATPPAGNSLIFAVFSLCVRRVFARVRQCVGGMFFRMSLHVLSRVFSLTKKKKKRKKRKKKNNKKHKKDQEKNEKEKEKENEKRKRN